MNAPLAILLLLAAAGCSKFDLLDAAVPRSGYARTSDVAYGPLERQDARRLPADRRGRAGGRRRVLLRRQLAGGPQGGLPLRRPGADRPRVRGRAAGLPAVPGRRVPGVRRGRGAGRAVDARASRGRRRAVPDGPLGRGAHSRHAAGARRMLPAGGRDWGRTMVTGGGGAGRAVRLPADRRGPRRLRPGRGSRPRRRRRSRSASPTPTTRRCCWSRGWPTTRSSRSTPGGWRTGCTRPAGRPRPCSTRTAATSALVLALAWPFRGYAPVLDDVTKPSSAATGRDKTR